MKAESKPNPIAVAIQLLLIVVLIPMAPLLISRQWNWWQAWAYAFVSIVGFIVSRALAVRRNPDILAERARMTAHENVEPWDRVLAPLVALGGGLIPIVAGLEELWNPVQTFDWALQIGALLVLMGGYVLGAEALLENRYFSGVVRIQSERDHHVISSGVYKWVRHPGYAGALLAFWAAPVLLDSLWAFGPAVFVTVALIVRTSLEDKTLQQKLTGYAEYTRHVRYRLVPGVW